MKNKHYEFTASVSLLMNVESEEGKSFIESGNAIYSDLQQQLETLGKELSETVKISLEGDGIISIDENAAITSLQEQISSILQKISNAEQSAQLDLIELKFGGGKLSLNSYESLMSELKKNIDDNVNAQDQAYKTLAAKAKLEFDSEKINSEEYNNKIAQLNKNYAANLGQTKTSVMDSALRIISEGYQNELGANAVGKLQNALSQSLTSGIDPIN